jgi:hypothetical protein
MSFLFIIENKVVKPHTETLLISPFKEIWKRDKSSKKDRATAEFTYIEFMVSVKKSNPYRGYTAEERQKRLCRDVMGDANFKPDSLVKDGIATLSNFQDSASPTMNYFRSAQKAAYKTREFFDTFDLSQVNPRTGALLYKPKDVTSTLIDTARVIQTLAELEEKVNNELYETSKIKGQKIVSVFADPQSL